MARADEMQRRAERLVAGAKNPRDLEALFLWLRDRSFGNRAVADIGDFVAHSDERERGIAWSGVQHFFNVADLAMPRGTAEPERKVTIEQLRAGALSAFELTDASQIKAVHGLGKKKARKVLVAALDAIISIEGKRPILRRSLSAKELELANHYTSIIISKPAFTGDELASQLATCLVKNGLIKNAKQLPPDAADFVALFAIEKMHLARILLRNGITAELQAGSSYNHPVARLGVNASVLLPDMAHSKVSIAFPIYITSLDPWVHCSPELLPEHPSMGTQWDHPLEIGADGKLHML